MTKSRDKRKRVRISIDLECVCYEDRVEFATGVLEEDLRNLIAGRDYTVQVEDTEEEPDGWLIEEEYLDD